jgi:hypothetical protein
MNLALYISILKEYITKSINIFPLIISTVSLILFSTIGSIPFLFLFIGIAIVVPVGVFLGQRVIYFLFRILPVLLKKSPVSDQYWKKIEISKSGESTSIFTDNSQTQSIVLPSYWLTSVFFFGSYLFTNARYIYDIKEPTYITIPAGSTSEKIAEITDKNSKIESKYNNRITASIILMVFSIIVPLILIIFKFIKRTESISNFILSFIVSGGIGIGIATGWVRLLMECNSQQVMDIFGITGQLRV